MSTAWRWAQGLLTVLALAAAGILAHRLEGAERSVRALQGDALRLRQHQLALQEAVVQVGGKLQAEIDSRVARADQRLSSAESQLSDVRQRLGDARMVRDTDTRAVIWE
jgi:hypothetical protein